MMNRFLICIAYKGTNYCGFQIQKNGNSIQSVLQDCLKRVFNEDITIFPSGRTDAGVHALKQYAHFDTSKNIPTDKIVSALNTFLPNDIRIYFAKQVDGNFHARFNVIKKTYMYVFSTSKITNPLFYDLVEKLDYKVDLQLIKLAIQKLKGEHNFKAFCSSKSSAVNFVRTIYDITVETKGDYLIFKVCGNGFLYNMVRIIIGTLIDIGRGQLGVDVIDKMFETGDRSYGGKTASQKGLYLFDVEYNPE